MSNPRITIVEAVARYHFTKQQIGERKALLAKENDGLTLHNKSASKAQAEALCELISMLRNTRMIQEGRSVFRIKAVDQEVAVIANMTIERFRALKDEKAMSMLLEAMAKVKMQSLQKTEHDNFMWYCTLIQIARHWGMSYHNLENGALQPVSKDPLRIWDDVYEFLAKVDLWEMNGVFSNGH